GEDDLEDVPLLRGLFRRGALSNLGSEDQPGHEEVIPSVPPLVKAGAMEPEREEESVQEEGQDGSGATLQEESQSSRNPKWVRDTGGGNNGCGRLVRISEEEGSLPKANDAPMPPLGAEDTELLVLDQV
ncbi:unnamed protein product, partial [Discosporangium mesarthrocarpum]